MAWTFCRVCGASRKIDIVSTPEGWKQPPCYNCWDPGYLESYEGKILSRDRRVKAADISDGELLGALDSDGSWTNLNDLCERLPYPWKVILAKCRTMIKKGRGLHGCYCGCRGDFHLAENCKYGCANPQYAVPYTTTYLNLQSAEEFGSAIEAYNPPKNDRLPVYRVISKISEQSNWADDLMMKYWDDLLYTNMIAYRVAEFLEKECPLTDEERLHADLFIEPKMNRVSDLFLRVYPDLRIKPNQIKFITGSES